MTGSALCSLLYLLPMGLWVPLPPCRPGSACLIWHVLFGRRKVVRGQMHAEGPAGAMQSIRTHCRQGTGAQDSLKQGSFCSDGCVVTHLGMKGKSRERGDRGEKTKKGERGEVKEGV